MKKTKSIHFTGIKGVGMTPLAIIAKQAGIRVSGSDVSEEFITDVPLKKAGILPLVGFAKEDIGKPDLLITTGAHGGLENPQAVFAAEKGVPVMTQGEAVGEFMKGSIFGREFKGISVAGSHGKTTVTAITATLFKESGLDPSYLIGTSDVPSLGLPGNYGKGKHFISEADEYSTDPILDATPKFMWQYPDIAVITNIELDHPDLFSSVETLRNEFLEFSNNLNGNGLLILSADDEQSRRLVLEIGGSKNLVTLGFSPKSDYAIEKISYTQGQTYFWVNSKGTTIGEFALNLAGDFNALNALFGIVSAIESGVPLKKIQEAIGKYKGSRRRFERIGKLKSGALLFDDYAHHPTEIKKTLRAFKEAFKNKKIICVFQPHTYSRTKIFFEDFANSFLDADTVVLTDIFSSAREEKDPSVSSGFLAKKMSLTHNSVEYAPSLSDVVKYIIQKNPGEDFIVLTMGAGNVYKIKDKLSLEK